MPIRSSSPIAWDTTDTSAPTSSQTFAISLMNEILVARNAFDAYLIISALAGSVRTTVAFRSVYSASTAAPSASSSAPITIRSGSMKSAMARPSRRNSGLDT